MTTSFGHADPQVLYSYCCSCPRLWLQSRTRATAWRVGRNPLIRSKRRLRGGCGGCTGMPEPVTSGSSFVHRIRLQHIPATSAGFSARYNVYLNNVVSDVEVSGQRCEASRSRSPKSQRFDRKLCADGYEAPCSIEPLNSTGQDCAGHQSTGGEKMWPKEETRDGRRSAKSIGHKSTLALILEGIRSANADSCSDLGAFKTLFPERGAAADVQQQLLPRA